MKSTPSIIPFYPSPEKTIITSKDCYQYDSDGKQYIDFEAGVWCANLGHSHERIVQVMESQIKKNIHHGYKFANLYADSLSEELQKVIGFQRGASVFLSSGSEAVNLAITLAIHQTGRKKILRIDSTYLSAYGYGRISSDNDIIIDIHFNDINSIQEVDFTKIAACVIETGGASFNPIQFPNPNFIDLLIDSALKNNCLLIADEVTTGLGRTGKWFGFQHYNFMPNIVVIGKALGNGYPVSAITVNEKVLEQFIQSPLHYAQSHQNDPLGCAIGLEVLKTIKEEQLLEICKETGNYFKNQLLLLQAHYPNKIKEVRARGLMLALELNKEIPNAEEIGNQLMDSGFITGYKANTLRFLPPLTISTKDINLLIQKLRELFSSSEGK